VAITGRALRKSGSKKAPTEPGLQKSSQVLDEKWESAWNSSFIGHVNLVGFSHYTDNDFLRLVRDAFGTTAYLSYDLLEGKR